MWSAAVPGSREEWERPFKKVRLLFVVPQSGPHEHATPAKKQTHRRPDRVKEQEFPSPEKESLKQAGDLRLGTTRLLAAVAQQKRWGSFLFMNGDKAKVPPTTAKKTCRRPKQVWQQEVAKPGQVPRNEFKTTQRAAPKQATTGTNHDNPGRGDPNKGGASLSSAPGVGL
jgi:hypothetical protein